jgi:hypothetical protein
MELSTRDILIAVIILQGIADILIAIKLDMIESSLGGALIYVGG